MSFLDDVRKELEEEKNKKSSSIKKGDSHQRISREERQRRRNLREDRIKKREEERKIREEIVNNTIYTNNPNKSTSYKNFGEKKGFFSKFKEEERIKENNMSRKRKKGKKVPFKELSFKGKMKRIFKYLFISGLLLFLILIGIGIALIYNVFKQDLALTETEMLLTNQNSEIYDRNGEHIATLAKDEKRKIINISEMSKYIPKAYIAIEDQRFYKHTGVDPKRTLGASAKYIFKGNSSYGGSTITQQLVKNLTRDDEQDWQRKVREITRAYQIEKKMSKQQILELYLNIIYVGGKNIHGIALGSDYYFSKNPKDLSLVESAFMAGINHKPAAYDPFVKKIDGESDKEFKKRREAKLEEINNRTITVLNKMKELGDIDQKEYDAAIKEVKEGIKFKEGTSSYATQEYSHLVDAAINELIDKIKDEKNIQREVASLAVYNGGYKIYVSQDSKIQKTLEEEMQLRKYRFASTKHKGKTTQAASVVMNHKTGEVVAAVGGLGKQTTLKQGDWNRVTRTKRQTGSVMKPVGVVAPGLEKGVLTAATSFNDSPLKIGEGKGNFRNYNGNYRGWMNIRKAIEVSENIPMLRAIQQIGVDASFKFLKDMDLPLVDGDKNIGSLALGGLTEGVTVKDMTGAYAMIANDGQYIRPTFINKVLNAKGEEVFKNKEKKKQMMSKSNAYILKDILREAVVGREGTCTYCRVRGFDTAAKTGTSNDNNDRWLCGFTNKYTMGVWFGYDEKEDINYYGINPAGQIWAAVMKEIHKKEKGEKFERPNDIIEKDVCRVSGKLPTELCSKDQRGSQVYREVFVKGTEPNLKCETHIQAEVCKKTGKLASDKCRAEDKTSKVFIKQDSSSTTDAKYRVPTEKCNCEGKSDKELEGEKNLKALKEELSSISNVESTSLSRLKAILNKYNSLSSVQRGELTGEEKGIISVIQKRINKEEKPAEENVADKEVEAVIALIANIPEKITTDNKAVANTAVKKARSKYNALKSEQKQKVTNISKLTSAEAKLAALE